MADQSPVLQNPEPDGVHFLVEFFGCQADSLNSMAFWKSVLIQSAEAAGLKVLNQHFFQFTPEGITGYLLLSTSHISIHTWPEHGYAACDVFSCGGDLETQEAVDSIIAKLPHQRVNLKRIKRGYRWFGYDAEGSIDFFETTRVGAPPVRIPVQRLVYKDRSAHQEIVICDTEIFGRCLLLDGTIQCSERDHDLYDRTMLHRLTPDDRRLLIIGGGDGYIAATAMQLNPFLAEITFDDLDGEVVNACGILKGGLVMTVLACAVNLLVLRFYDWSKRDWLGIETIKGMKSYSGESRFRRLTAWVLQRSDPVVLIFLSLKEDAFITLIYLRHGSHQYNGMSKRDWSIFLSSLVIANIYWTLAAYMGISLVEWAWQVIRK